jgi:hypothetical protein
MIDYSTNPYNLAVDAASFHAAMALSYVDEGCAVGRMSDEDLERALVRDHATSGLLLEREFSRRVQLNIPERACPACPGYHGRGTCPACQGSGAVPGVILASVARSFPRDAAAIVESLRWSSDHWGFSRLGMYVGIERDGHIHT